MPIDLYQLIYSKEQALKTYNALASPTQAQTNAIVKEMVQAMAAMIFLRQNHPDDTP